jgi:hypothetical protein
MVEVAGRRTLPANAMVEQSVADWDLADPEAERQLDFGLVLAAREQDGVAGRAGEAEVVKSWTRVQWDMAQP